MSLCERNEDCVVAVAAAAVDARFDFVLTGVMKLTSLDNLTSFEFSLTLSHEVSSPFTSLFALL